MKNPIEICLGVALSLAVAGVAGPAAAQAPVTPARTIEALADGVWLLHGRFDRGRQPDGNTLLLQGPEGLVVIDSGRHAEHAAAIAEFAAGRKLPLRALVNTHWHLDHLGGNAALKRAEPHLRVHASRAVQDTVDKRMPGFADGLRRMLAEPDTDADTRRMIDIDLALYAERERLLPDVLLPEADTSHRLAGRALRIGIERGVSGGDAWVLDEASGTLAVGDFVTLPAPFFDTACAEQWRSTMARLSALPFERIVPGHGAPMTRAEFGRYREALDKLVSCAASDRPVADCSAAWVADLGPLLPAGSERAAQGMTRHYISNHLRAAPAERDRFCAG